GYRRDEFLAAAATACRRRRQAPAHPPSAARYTPKLTGTSSNLPSWYLNTVTVLWYYNDAMIFRQAGTRAATPGGRVAQKQRTRMQLLQAARELRAAGRVPSVADVADASGISRTTAYRYFPTQEMLLAEATADPLIDAVAESVARVRDETDVVNR